MYRGGGVHFHSHYYGGSSSYDDESSAFAAIVVGIVLVVALIIFGVKSCNHTKEVNEYAQSVVASNVYNTEREYTCDYSEKKKITTVHIDDQTFTISGQVYKNNKGNLTMTRDNNETVAYVEDSANGYVLHVNGRVEAVITGGYNSDTGNYVYHLYNEAGDCIGKAEYDNGASLGTIYDAEGNGFTIFSSTSSSNTYHLKVYDNKICTDKAIIMINAIFISEWMVGE